MEVISLTGSALQDALPALADLRIRVFRDWPYLYDGHAEYEEKYLRKFSRSEGALVVIARDEDGEIVGASTASPLVGHADEFAAPFTAAGYDPHTIFYFGESVLLPAYRGRGIGRAFFEHRERHARADGRFTIAAFCGVVRSADDPRKPESYAPLDLFWGARGFAKAQGLTASLTWKEIGSEGETPHTMQFWIKDLRKKIT